MAIKSIRIKRVEAHARRGVAAVELAIVGSLLFMLLIGLVNYGLIFLRAQEITLAARAGARAAVVVDATNASVNAMIDAIMDKAGIETYSVDLSPDDVSTVSPGDTVRVQVTVETSNLALIDSNILPIPAQLSGAASMAKEGP